MPVRTVVLFLALLAILAALALVALAAGGRRPRALVASNGLAAAWAVGSWPRWGASISPR